MQSAKEAGEGTRRNQTHIYEGAGQGNIPSVFAPAAYSSLYAV